MAVSLRLERFGWAPPDGLTLSGRWYGLDDPDARTPTLVVHTASDVHRLQAVPDTTQAGSDSPWSASFTYDGDPSTIARIELAMGEDLIVELPLPVVGSRRFGRQLLRAVRTPGPTRHFGRVGRPRASEAAAGSPRAEQLAQAEVPDADRPQGGERLDVGNGDRAEVARLGSLSFSRLHEALEAARALADEEIAAEREAAAAVVAELESTRAALASERSDRSRLEAEAQAARRDRAELDALVGDLRQQVDALTSEVSRRQAGLDEHIAAHAQLRAALDQALHGEQVARARAEALQQRVDAALAAFGDS